MDGIELVSVAHKLQPDLEMVIFSGYGEFEYAKKAMASGVSNYVLKPVDPAEFENTLNLLVEKITERRNEAQRSQWNQVLSSPPMFTSSRTFCTMPALAASFSTSVSPLSHSIDT